MPELLSKEPIKVECLGFVKSGVYSSDCNWTTPIYSRTAITEHVEKHEKRKEVPIIHKLTK